MSRSLVTSLLLLVCAACGDDAAKTADSGAADSGAIDSGAVEDTDATADAGEIADTAADSAGARDGSGAAEDTDADAPADAPADAAVEPVIVPLWDNARITSDGSQPNFQNVRTEFDWGTGPFARVILVMDLSSTCFPFEGWADNRPPAGQNWPADCDAFDRNYEVTLDDPEAEGDAPAVELMRAITPFGGPLHLEVDVTDIANGLPGAHRLRTHITTWSDGAGQVSGSNGGWNVSGHLEVTQGAAPREVLAVIPLYNQTFPAPYDPVELPFETPEGTTSAVVEYRVTGHGGTPDSSSLCVGPAEEFCKRYHHLVVDGDEVAVYQPWRDDCATLCTLTTSAALGGQQFCLENPCGAVGSVQAPRANWCPGSLTPPRRVEVPATGAGAHSFGFSIDRVKQDGGWRVSAVAIAYGDGAD